MFARLVIVVAMIMGLATVLVVGVDDNDGFVVCTRTGPVLAAWMGKEKGNERRAGMKVLPC